MSEWIFQVMNLYIYHLCRGEIACEDITFFEMSVIVSVHTTRDFRQIHPTRGSVVIGNTTLRRRESLWVVVAVEEGEHSSIW